MNFRLRAAWRRLFGESAGRHRAMRRRRPQILPQAAELLESRVLLTSITQLNVFDTWDGNVIPSTDAAGLTYHPDSGRLFIADSEINEIDEYQGHNAFEVSLDGTQLFGEYDTGNGEPTGIAYSPFDGFFYVTNDDEFTVTRYDAGLNVALEEIHTDDADSRITDPEGITADLDGNLYVVNGEAAGNNRLVAAFNSDLELQYIFDIEDRMDDAEGIAYNPLNDHLYIVSDPEQAIFEYTLDGTFVQQFDLGDFSPTPDAPQGLTFAPTSDTGDDPAALALYIADGEKDNDPDGRVYEAIIGDGLFTDDGSSSGGSSSGGDGNNDPDPEPSPPPDSSPTSSGDWSDPAIASLDPVSIDGNTEHKPQSKLWQHDGRWWAALSTGSGTHVFRLDGEQWTEVLDLTSTRGNTDVRSLGETAYVFIQDGSQSELATIRYTGGTYELVRLSNVPVPSGIETATIDVDSTGRLWAAYDSDGRIEVIYSDPPYTSWSGPIVLADDVRGDDISVVTALPDGTIGVLWSDQNDDRFGFRLHVDGTNPNDWQANEVPASQSAVNEGSGMADDHLNVAVASDGTLYAAVKTGHKSSSLPLIGLLVRRPNGEWDPLHFVDADGTRPIVQLDEAAGLLLVFYKNKSSSGPMMYRYSSTSSIDFSDEQLLIDTSDPNDITGSKQNFNGELVVIASEGGEAIGRRLTFGPPGDPPPAVNAAPFVFAGSNQTIPEGESAELDASVTDDGLPDGQTVGTVWSVVAAPDGGSAMFDDRFAVDTQVTFSQAGDYTLRLIADDGELSGHDDVTISVESFEPPPNSPPDADDDAYSVPQDGVLNVTAADGVLSNDVDADQDPLTAVLENGPAHGTLTLNADGSFEYVPAAGFIGTDSFIYRAGDAEATSPAATVTVNVFDSSTPTTLEFQQGRAGYSGARDTAIHNEDPGDSFGSDDEVEVDGRPAKAALLGWDIGAIPAGSTVVSASIRIDVTSKTNDVYPIYQLVRQWSESQATWEQAADGADWASAGASGPSDRGSTVLGELTGSKGLTTFELNAAGLAVLQQWIDDPSSNFGLIIQKYENASDGIDFRTREESNVEERPLLSITFHAGDGNNDGGGSEPPPPNQSPLAADVDAQTAEDEAVDITLTGSDPDGQPVTYIVLDQPEHGTLSGSGADLTYRPDDDYHGSDAFTYRVYDGVDFSEPATVTIDVDPVNDRPSEMELSGDTLDEDADTSLPVTVGTLSATDADASDSHTFRLVAGAGDDDNARFLISGHELQLAAGTPLDFDTQSSYSVRIEVDDGSAALEATFTIDVVPHNDAPTDISLTPAAIDENISTSSAVTVGTLSAADPDAGDSHTYRLVSGDGDDDNSLFRIVGDQLQIEAGTGVDFENQGSYQVRVEVSDGVDTFRKSLVISVNNQNDAPVAAGESYETDLDQLLVVGAADGVLSNDTDQDGHTLTAQLQQMTSHGTLDLAGDGSFTYQPEAGFSGSDQFTYRAGDGSGTSAAVLVTIDVVDTSIVDAEPVTLSFQQGRDGYDGARDTFIDGDDTRDNFGSEDELETDGRPEKAALLGWDISAIPAGSTVLSASIQIDITSKTDDAYPIYQLHRQWVEQEATWEQAADGAQWTEAGGRADRGATVLGELSGSKGLATFELNAAGRAVLEQWIDDPASNFGLIIQNYDNASDGLDFRSREERTVDERPLLTITFQPPAGGNLLRAASSPAHPREAAELTETQLAGLVAAAGARWQAAGLSDDAAQWLRGAHVEIADLPGRQLGRVAGRRILLDANAAGFGWFVDATPLDDEEFDADGLAVAAGPAEGYIDLLSVLLHEQGHLLGFDHDESGLLQPTLPAGTRHTPPSDWQAADVAADLADVDEVFAHWHELDALP